MDDKQMREAFEAKWPMPRYCVWTGRGYAATHHTAWDAHAYRRKWEGWREGYAAGMERGRKEGLDEAATLMQMHAKAVCAQFPDAIRAEIPGDRNG
ncbi:hypothetical protein K7G19_07315 [Cupriavidus sp. DB3]|uniref:hypothetical protein n=1 Tax=Cupriavidus sp. DB3 TaxID=2873259 RepID=UPI001CF48D88|nr:hypothetical protein [Cupriavidus sp. DB3]MCA7083407.1 hypothetical protein [Cupriavidus sp. DB3]